MGFESWAAIWGDWDFGAGAAVFRGKPESGGRIGLALGPGRITAGEILTTVSFAEPAAVDVQAATSENPPLPPGARIVFGFDPLTEVGFEIGIGAVMGRYVAMTFSINSEMQKPMVLAAKGEVQPFPADTEIECRARITGSRVTLTVDGTTVIESDLPIAPTGSQVGLRAYGGSVVTFHDFRYEGERPQIFVVMQFGPKFDDIFTEVIEPVAERAGFESLRADEIYGPGAILTDIIGAIRTSAVVVADVSLANPNVYYEVGYAHAVGTPTILLIRRGETIPFDISGFRCIIYDDSIGGKRKIETELERHLAAITATPIPLI